MRGLTPMGSVRTSACARSKRLVVAALCSKQCNHAKLTRLRQFIAVQHHVVWLRLPRFHHALKDLQIVDRGIVFPVPKVVVRHRSVPRIEPFADERQNLRLVVPLGLLQSVQGFTCGVQPAQCHVAGGDEHASFVVITTGLRQNFPTRLDGLRPQTSEGFFPHCCAGLFLPYERLIAGEVVGLNANEHVDVFVVCSVFDEILQFIPTLKTNSTFPSFVGIEVKSEIE